jgi:hypothetical protein
LIPPPTGFILPLMTLSRILPGFSPHIGHSGSGPGGGGQPGQSFVTKISLVSVNLTGMSLPISPIVLSVAARDVLEMGVITLDEDWASENAGSEDEASGNH